MTDKESKHGALKRVDDASWECYYWTCVEEDGLLNEVDARRVDRSRIHFDRAKNGDKYG